MGIRIASGIFNLLLAIVLFAYIRPVGPLSALAALPLAGSALVFWTVYQLQQDTLRRAGELEHSRTYLMDDAAGKLRGIEQDLHDGAQAQMVAVAMKLGLATRKLSGMIDRSPDDDLERVLVTRINRVAAPA